MPKGELVPKILEILQAQSESTVNLLDIAFSAGPGDLYRKSRRLMKYGPKRFKTDWASEYREQQNFYSILNQLKNQGFIKKEKNLKQSIWRITKKGLVKLKLIKKKRNLKKLDISYQKSGNNKSKIIIFDIPEKERHKRDWLRIVLTNLKFSLLQESVWIGKNKIPKQLIYELRERKMLPYIHIFEISKQGTITSMP